jgi:MFS family permease
LFILGSGVCAVADHVPVLILGRVIQALGSCGMMVMAFTIAKDLFDGVRLAKSCSYLNMIVACSPMFAPFVGSYLHIYLGWRANFIVLVLMGVVTYLLHSLLLPETIRVKQRMGLDLFFVYWQTMKYRCFQCYAAASAFGLTYIFLFCAMSPVILMTHLGVPEAQYGYYFAFMGISFLSGSMIANILVSRVGIYRTVLVGFVLSLVGGIVMLIWYALYGMSSWNFVIPMLIIGSGGSCAMSAGSAGAISHISSNTGLASSLCTGLRFSFAAVMGLLVSQHVHNTLPLSVSAVVFSCVGLFVFLINRPALDHI